MAGFLDGFRKKVVTSLWKDVPDERKVQEINDKIALGVLMWVVAEADQTFLPEEKGEIEHVLNTFSHIPKAEIPLILAAIHQAAEERVDIHEFTHELNQDLPYPARITILEELFRVACADKELASAEIEEIRKIAGLFQVSHKDFIDAKIRIKKEFGLETAA